MFTIDMRKVVCNVISESLKLLCERWEWFVELGIDCMPDCFGVLVLTWIRSLHQSGDTILNRSPQRACQEVAVDDVVGFKRCIITSFSFQLDWILKCKKRQAFNAEAFTPFSGEISVSSETCCVYENLRESSVNPSLNTQELWYS